MIYLGLHRELARTESVRRLEHLPGEPGRRARRSLTDWLFAPQAGRAVVDHHRPRDADRGARGQVHHDEGKT